MKNGKPVPCKCAAYPFPHRKGSCVDLPLEDDGGSVDIDEEKLLDDAQRALDMNIENRRYR